MSFDKCLPSEFIENAPLVLATKQVCGQNRLPVLFAFRTTPNNETDSGWKFWSGLEDQEYIDNNSNTIVCSLRSFLEIDPTLTEIIDYPFSSAWEREYVFDSWRPVYDYFGN